MKRAPTPHRLTLVPRRGERAPWSSACPRPTRWPCATPHIARVAGTRDAAIASAGSSTSAAGPPRWCGAACRSPSRPPFGVRRGGPSTTAPRSRGGVRPCGPPLPGRRPWPAAKRLTPPPPPTHPHPRASVYAGCGPVVARPNALGRPTSLRRRPARAPRRAPPIGRDRAGGGAARGGRGGRRRQAVGPSPLIPPLISQAHDRGSTRVRAV